MRKTPHWFDPSNLHMTDPNAEAFDIGVLNLQTSNQCGSINVTQFLKCFTHVNAVSQLFDKLGPYTESSQINITALTKMVWVPLAAIRAINLALSLQF